jgi:hypothetical protein
LTTTNYKLQIKINSLLGVFSEWGGLIGRSENQLFENKMVKRRRNLFKTPSLLDDSSDEEDTDIGEELSLTQGAVNSPATGTLMNSGKQCRDDEST